MKLRFSLRRYLPNFEIYYAMYVEKRNIGKRSNTSGPIRSIYINKCKLLWIIFDLKMLCFSLSFCLIFFHHFIARNHSNDFVPPVSTAVVIHWWYLIKWDLINFPATATVKNWALVTRHSQTENNACIKYFEIKLFKSYMHCSFDNSRRLAWTGL